VIALAWIFRAQGGSGQASAKVPIFLLGFCVCVIVNSLGVVPEFVTAISTDFSGWCLMAAVAAIGIKTNLKELFTIGYQPIVMLLSETVFIAAWVVVGLMLLS